MTGCVTRPRDIVLTRKDYIRYAERNAAHYRYEGAAGLSGPPEQARGWRHRAQPRAFAAIVSNRALTALLKLQPNRLGHGCQAAVWQLFCMLDQTLVIAVELRKGRSTRLVDTEELTAVEVAAADDDLDKAA